MSDIYEGIDLGFRPSSRVFPMTAEKFLLSRVKGTWRRDILELAVEEDRLLEVDPFFTAVSLSDEERKARSAVHPSFMGGEYLPDFEDDEVEVARIELNSVTGDVISIRGSQTQDGFRYRVVDEYDNEYLLEPTEITIDKPLCLGDFGKFVCRAANLVEIVSLNEFEDVTAAQKFIRGSSQFYPEFSRYISRTVMNLVPTSEEQSDSEGGSSRIAGGNYDGK